MCETFNNIGIDTFSGGLQDIYEDCDLNREGVSIGIVTVLFDKYITNDADKTALIVVLNQTKTFIALKGSELSIATLEGFESRKTDNYFKVPWAYPIKTESLITTIDMIIQLLNGTWNSDNYSVYYTGFPNSMNMPEI
jgi:hypothetical protein